MLLYLFFNHSVHGEVCDTFIDRPSTDTPQADTPPAQCMLGYTHPLPSACWDMVNKRMVRILLECILVNKKI